MPRDLIAVGLNAVDVLIRLPIRIDRNEKQMVSDLVIQGGAPAGSAVCGLGRLGYQVAFVARVGGDTVGAICLAEFQRSGVSTDLIVRDADSRPALALVEIDPLTAERTVFIQMDHYGFLRKEDVPVGEIGEARVLLVDSYDLHATETALDATIGTRCRSVLDFESGDPGRMRSLIAKSTDPILPATCARALTGHTEPADAVLALAELGPGRAVVTDGIKGSWATDGSSGSVLHQPAFKVRGVDSTGCGDAFHAGYAAGLLEGWPFAIGLEFAALLASRVATQIGGRTALPYRHEIRSLLRPEVSDGLRERLDALADRRPVPAA